MSRPRKAVKHGTIGGYMAHRRRGEQPCISCKTAWRIYYQQKRDALPRVVAEKNALRERRRRESKQREYKARRHNMRTIGKRWPNEGLGGVPGKNYRGGQTPVNEEDT